MADRIGVIAGSGFLAGLLLEESRKKGYQTFAACLKGFGSRRLKGQADVFDCFGLGEIGKLVSYFRRHGVARVLMAGKIDQRSLYRIRSMDATASRILKGVEVKTAGNLLSAFIRYLQGEGIEILDPTPFLESFFPAEGNLTRHVAISPEVRQEMEFGWKAAKVLADLDIGQTVVVKNRAVVAVEGIEGTDETILRGGRMAGKGTVVVKVGRTSQDPRIDLPAVGLGTIRSLARIRAAALCLEARKMPFFHQEAALLLAESRGIAVMARSA